MSVHLFTPRRAANGALLGASPGRFGGEDAEFDGEATGAAGKSREAASLLLVAAAVYLLLALAGVRIDPTDASMAGSDWVGPVGAEIGGILARGFGLVEHENAPEDLPEGHADGSVGRASS